MEHKPSLEYHLVLVRHGESEGDVRRRTLRDGGDYATDKSPRSEEQTSLGHKQSVTAGKWITRYVLKEYSIAHFDLCAVSPLIRTRQSADSLGITGDWRQDQLLTERNRGRVQGLVPSEHKRLFPESYDKMKKHPFHWVPVDGESILKVADRAQRFLEKTRQEGHRSVLVAAHRDWIWAAHVPLERLSIDEAEAINTDLIRNAQIIHYTNVDPSSRQISDGAVIWKRSVCPWQEAGLVEKDTNDWRKIDYSRHADMDSDQDLRLAA